MTSTESLARPGAINAIKQTLIGGYPVVAIETWEEDQTVATLKALSNSVFQGKGEFASWDMQAGLCVLSTGSSTSLTAEEALDTVAEASGPGFFVFRDLTQLLDKPEIQRRIKNLNSKFSGQNKFLFLTGTEFIIPPDLRKDIMLISYDLPNQAELGKLLEESIENLSKRGVEISLNEDQKCQAVNALKGFTASEAKYALNKASWGRKSFDADAIEILHHEKEQLARKDGVLEYVRAEESLQDVGGLENLKDWLVKRKRLFTDEAAKAGIRPPRGLLMMGISGCGKSLSVKAISSLWSLPLFRLDMNKVYSGVYGTPEGTFHRAVKSIEAVSPAILWIDEIEGGISSNTAKDGGTGSHIFSAFLTWMQEKSADVFVAATANRIDLLPAEIIRKGRFDQVFFIDLPNDEERESIFKVHLKRRGNNLEEFDLPLLSVATEFWNGAEIEHVVEAAMVEAFHRNEKLHQDDLYTIIRSTVPLSRTMSEQIKFIKNWASERAVSASVKSDKD